ncbi:MAG: 1-acyl-sn-glycerol-3-phosphate acyltransferase, partial [Pyrinomonadaceae bacterium]
MNRGRIKRFLTFLQRHLGATWIHLATYNVMNVYGFENVRELSFDRPVILISNHRSFFDMYVVSSHLLRHIRHPLRLFFPVRGKFFYQTIGGMLVNLIMGWWSMYPPFFSTPEKKMFDKYALRKLAEICRRNEKDVCHIVGF